MSKIDAEIKRLINEVFYVENFITDELGNFGEKYKRCPPKNINKEIEMEDKYEEIILGKIHKRVLEIFEIT